MTSPAIFEIMGPKDIEVTSISLGPIISKLAGDTDSVTIGHLQEMAPGVSNGHLTGDAQWRI